MLVPFISEMKTTWRASCRSRLGVNRADGGIVSLHGEGVGRDRGREGAGTGIQLGTWLLCESRSIQKWAAAFPTSESSEKFSVRLRNTSRPGPKEAEGFRAPSTQSWAGDQRGLLDTMDTCAGTCPGSLGAEDEKREEPSGGGGAYLPGSRN